MSLTVEQQTIIRSSLDPTGYVIGAKQIVEANAQIAASGDQVVQSSAKVTRSITDGGAAFDRLKRSLDPVYASAQNYARVQDTVTRALQNGRASQDDASRVLDQAAQKYGVLTNAQQAFASGQSAGVAQYRATTDALQRMADAQAAIGKLGAGGVAPASGVDAYGAQLDALRAKIPPLTDAQQRYAQQLAELDVQVKAGTISEEQADIARSRALGSFQSYSAAVDNVRSGLVPIFAAQQQYQTQLASIDAAVKIGAITETEATSARDQATASYLREAGNIRSLAAAADDLRTSYGDLYASQRQYQAQLDAIAQDQSVGALTADQAAAGRQQAINQLIGVSQPNADQTAARAKDVQAYGDALDALRAKYNPVFAVSKQYEAELNDIAKAEQIGAISATEAAAARDRATKSFSDQTGTAKALGLAQDDVSSKAQAAKGHMDELGHGTAGVTREFIVLGHEVLVGNYNRIPGSILVLSERMGSLRNAITSVAYAVASPTGLAVLGGVAGVGLLAAFAASAEVAARKLEALRDTLSATRADYATLAPQVQQAARALSATSTLTKPEATTLISTVDSSPLFQGTQAQASDIARTFYDLNLVMGDAAGDAKRLGEALNDPAKVIQDLTDHHVRGFTEALVNQALQYEATGNKAAALALLLDNLKHVNDDVRGSLTPLQEAMRKLDAAFMGATGSAKGFVDGIGTQVTNALAAVISDLADFVKWIGAVSDAIDKIPFLRSATNLAGSVLNADPAQLGYSAGQYIRHQFSGPGGALTSSAGAVGTFQLLPSTAAGITIPTLPGIPAGAAGQAVNPYNQTQNIIGGLLYIQQLSQARRADNTPRFGSEDAISRAYNVGPDGNLFSGAAIGYSGKVAAASPGSLPTDVASQIAYWGGVLGLPDNLISLGERIAVVESGGHQTAPAVTQLPGVAQAFAPGEPGITQPAGARGTGTGVAPIPSAYGLGTDPNAATNAVDKLYQDAVQFQRISIQGQIDQFTKFRDAVGANSTEGQHASAVIQDLRVKLDGLRDPLTAQQQIAQTAHDSVAPLEAEGGAARDLVQVYQQFANLSRDTHQPIDQTALTSALADKQRDLTAQANENTRLTLAQAESQARLTPLIEQGGVAAELASNGEKALSDARKTAIPGSAEYARQVAAETQALNFDTLAKNDNSAASDVHQFNDESTLLQAEISLLGASTAQRNREIAAIQERIRRGVGLSGQLTDEQQKAVDAAQAAADYQTQLQQQSQDMGEITGAFGQAFDTIGSGIVDAFTNGQTAAQNFQNIMTTVAKQILNEFLKLAVINPLLNSLFPGQNNLPTIGGVFGTLQGGSGGGGGLLGLLGIGGEGVAAGGVAAGFAGAAADTAASTVAAESFGILALHSGGVVGSDAGAPRTGIAPSVFAGAPRFHTGLAPDEFPAILQVGERVLSVGQRHDLNQVLHTNVFHTGGAVGGEGAASRYVHAAYFDDAPRFHDGLTLGQDEFAAILQRGERVLTAPQQQAVVAAAGDGKAQQPVNQNVVFNISTPNADSFRRSEGQIYSRAVGVLARSRQGFTS